MGDAMSDEPRGDNVGGGSRSGRDLTHFDPAGRARMVDVGEKEVTHRVAVAAGRVTMRPETVRLIREGRSAKGDVLAVAQVAAIMAAKKTHELIPMCHPLLLTKIEVGFEVEEAAVAISARVEAELGELGDAGEAAAMRAELGIAEAGLERLIGAAFELLELIVFFTADEGKEAMARSLRRGGTAWEAAGTIHGEIQDAFVKAEVIGWRDLVDAGGYAPARDRGKLRIEGRDYVVADGDVITIKV